MEMAHDPLYPERLRASVTDDPEADVGDNLETIVT